MKVLASGGTYSNPASVAVVMPRIVYDRRICEGQLVRTTLEPERFAKSGGDDEADLLGHER